MITINDVAEMAANRGRKSSSAKKGLDDLFMPNNNQNKSLSSPLIDKDLHIKEQVLQNTLDDKEEIIELKNNDETLDLNITISSNDNKIVNKKILHETKIVNSDSGYYPSQSVSDHTGIFHGKNQKKEFNNIKENSVSSDFNKQFVNAQLSIKQIYEANMMMTRWQADEKNFLLAVMSETNFGELKNVPIHRNVFISEYKVQEKSLTKVRVKLQEEGVISFYDGINDDSSRRNIFYTLKIGI